MYTSLLQHKSRGYKARLTDNLAVAKILGIIMILCRKSQWLTEWAYAGFFFDLILATWAHHNAGHGVIGFSLYALIALFPSYFLGKYLRD